MGHANRSVRSLFAGLMALGLLVALAACGDDDDSASSSVTTAAAARTSVTTAAAAGTSATTAATAAAAGTTAAGGGAGVTEVIKSFSFTTKEVHVAVGGTVVFDNQDSTTHTATADDGSFDTGNIAAGSQKTVSFPKAGTFTFHCKIHASMTGSIVVA